MYITVCIYVAVMCVTACISDSKNYCNSTLVESHLNEAPTLCSSSSTQAPFGPPPPWHPQGSRCRCHGAAPWRCSPQRCCACSCPASRGSASPGRTRHRLPGLQATSSLGVSTPVLLGYDCGSREKLGPSSLHPGVTTTPLCSCGEAQRGWGLLGRRR